MSLVNERQYARSKRWITSRFPAVGAILILVLLWEGLARLIGNNRILPNVMETWNALVANQADLTYRLLFTFTSVIMAFIMAVLAGVLLGIVIAELFTLRQMFMPVIIFGYAIPHPVMAPVFIVWFFFVGDITLLEFTSPTAYIYDSGAGADAQLSFAITGISTFGAWVAFFPIFLNTVTGMNQLEERHEHLGALLGASRWQMVRYFRFWRALPNIASSIKAAVQLSIVGTIVAEFLTTGTGIGYQIVLAWKNANLPYMFGVVIVIMVGAYAFFQFVSWLTRKLTPPDTV